MTSYAEMIDYEAQFTELARRGIVFGEKDKQLFRDICTTELKAWDGNSTITSSFSATGLGLLEGLLKFVAEIFNGNFNFNDIGGTLSSAYTNATHTHSEFMLNRAAMNIYLKFNEQGGNFARAAQLVTGQKPVTSVEEAGPEVMQSSIYNQIHKAMNIPEGTKSSLNSGRSI